MSAANNAGSPGIHPKVMGQNPLSGGVASATKKLGDNLSGCVLISEIQWKTLLDRLKSCENNDDRLAMLDREKLPFLFSSAQLMTMLDITLSVKTRLTMITQVGPRLTDPKAKSSQLIALFRYSEEKERVEGVLKARTKVVMASNTSLFRPQGNLAATLVADHSNHSSTQQQNNQSTSAVPSMTIKGLAGARQKPVLAAINPLQPYESSVSNTTTSSATTLDISPVNDSLAESSIWRDVNTPPRGTKKEPASYTTTSTTTTKTTRTDKVAQLPLQEGWTPMHDTSTGQIYYYNEITGDSQWDPPLAVESPSSREQKKMLPFGWTIMKDPSTGSVYYYNRTTGESTWDFPREKTAAVQSTSTASPVRSTSTASPVQQQPQPVVVQQQPQPVVVHTNTSSPAAHISSSPIALPTPPPEPPRELPRPLPDGWSSQIDPASGATYYVHRASNTSQWEVPQEVKIVAPPPPPVPPTPVVPTLPYGWSEMYDERSGKLYYANHLTGQSQWEIPV